MHVCPPAFPQWKSETRTRGFLSECSCCLLVYWVRIYYSAIFLCYVLQRRGELERRESERERGPSNSTGVHTHWIVWSSWVARLFLAPSNSLALYWSHWQEEEAVWSSTVTLIVWERELKLVTKVRSDGFNMQCRHRVWNHLFYASVSVFVVVRDCAQLTVVAFSRLTRKNKEASRAVPGRAALQHRSFLLLPAHPSLLC